VRERLIPKRDGRRRRLGIPTLKDRVCQMALKLVLEPIFESGFYASSYAYRPARRAQDAIAEIVHFTKAPSHYEYADDLLLLVKGTREQAEALLEQLAGRVEALGLSLKSEKTAVTHIDEGFVFLGQRIVRRPKGKKRHVYTFVSNEALASARRKVKALTGRSTTNLELSELIAALNPVLRGRGNYFRHAAAKARSYTSATTPGGESGVGFARSTHG
jgi:hypothetical protein